MRHIKISDMKPGLVYEIPGYSMWLGVEVQAVRGHYNSAQYVDFKELTIDGEDAGDVSNATFTFVNGIMHGSEYDILEEGK